MNKTQEIVLYGHLNEVASLALTSDNKYIVSGSTDNTIKIWSLLEKKQYDEFQGNFKVVTCIKVTLW